MRDGRYEGGDGTIEVVLRVDRGQLGVVSGDVRRDGGHVASVRTAPGVRVGNSAGPWPAVWRHVTGESTTGALSLAPVAGRNDALHVTLGLDQRLNGLPPGPGLAATVARTGGLPRELGLEVETETGVRPPAPVPFQGAALDKREALRAVGFALRDVGERTAIPRREDGWDYSDIFTVLHDLMTAKAQELPADPAWELRLLMLSRTNRPGLMGIMFDLTEPLPRQGAAVFVDEIRDHATEDQADTKVVMTTLHEVGHAFNLVHRFERRVGRADSTSYMNYPELFAGGRDEFWRRFEFQFDPDELEFLRHGYRTAVVPGGSPFGSVTYWADGGGGYAPYLPEVSVPGFRLTLEPPQNGPVFEFGQPVFLQVSLENQTDAPVRLPRPVLDPKAGLLEVLVRRDSGAPGELAEAERFVPIVHACRLEEPRLDELLPGGVWRDNLNLTFGSGGFPFAEPGTY